MKKIKEWFMKCKSSRKLRCGGFSALLSVCAAIVVLAVSALADSVESKYALTLDLSFNAATTLSETTKNALAALEKPVHVYMLIPETGANETLLSLLERYAAMTERLTWTRESVRKNPALLTRFADAIGENEVTSDCLIVSCPETGRARVLTEDDYYVFSYNIETGFFDEAGYTYEKSLTEAILYVSQDELPTVQLLSGHGEMAGTDIAQMTDTLISANYLMKTVNLLAGDEPDPQSPMMILSPRYDLTDGELEKIMAFAGAGGDLFIVTTYADPLTLENVNALLRAYGAEAIPGLVIATEDDRGSYYADTPVWLIPYMQECEATMPLLTAKKDILLLAGARAFRLPEKTDTELNVYSVLETGKAYIRDIADGSGDSGQQPQDETGYFPVAVWTDRFFPDGTLSRAFICGNLTVFNDYWTVNNTDSTAFLLQMLRSLQGQEPVNLNILPINALREEMSMAALTPAVIVTVMIPLLAVVFALLVLLPRRNL